MRILVIVPILSKSPYGDEIHRFLEAQRYVRPDTEVDFVNIDYGPASIESHYDECIAAPFVVRKAEWAERNGYDAVVVNCMMDPGVKAAREAVNIPVIGPGETTRKLAAILGNKVFSVYPTGIPVLELHKNPNKTFKSLVKNAQKAIEDGADALIIGCTGLSGLANKLQEKVGMPVLENLGCALKVAEMFVDLGVSHSKRTYPKPSEKKRILPE